MTSVASRFRDRVFVHLVTNMMKTPLAATPLILAIHGEPGTGKSFQLDHSLRDLTYYKTISSSDLESANANDPAKLVRSTYLDVADEVAKMGYLSGALVINDIDSALGDWGPLVQTTVNRQMVIGELQHITDYPEQVDNRPNLRIPIFVTANDLTKLYGPLLRPGRTDSFYWLPSTDEISSVLCDALPHLTPIEVSKFVTHVDSSSIVDHLDIVRTATITKVGRIPGGPHEVLRSARRGELELSLHPTLDDLLAASSIIVVERQRHKDYTRSVVWPQPTPTRAPMHDLPSSK